MSRNYLPKQRRPAKSRVRQAIYKTGKNPQIFESHTTQSTLVPTPEEIGHLMSLFNQGLYPKGEAFARQQTKRFPQHGFSWMALGVMLKLQGRPVESLEPMQKATILLPNDAEAHYNLGNTLKDLGRMEEAKACCRRALEIKPDYAEAHYNLGKILKDLSRLQEAEACFRRALVIKPDFTEVHNNLSITLQELGRLQEAEACCRRALEIKPDFAEAHNNLGNILHCLSRLEEAEASYRRAAESRPNFAEAHSNLGNTLKDLGRWAEAITCFRRALEIKPDFAEAQSNLGNILCDLGRLEEAINCYCTAIRLAPGKPELLSNLLFCLNYTPGMSQEQMMAEATVWWEHHGHAIAREFSHHRTMAPHRRLKIGYVSPDFRQHAVSFFFLPLIMAHEPKNVETFCYGEVINPDLITAEIIKHSDHYRSTVGLRHETLAELIYQDEIDILVDLAGHSAHNRLPVFALRPAPIQLTWLGYPNTTGLQSIDFRLTDAVADPEGKAGPHSEILVRLPHGFHCYIPPSEVPEVGELPAALTNRITFGSFNNLPKINRETIKIWSEIMHRVPNSRLMLKNKQLADSGTKKYFLEMFVQEGIEEGRIIMLSHTPSVSDHLDLYNQVDIGLDTFPYNGTTTTFEALMMGVPVITLRGDRHAGRVGASILTHMGLQEMIAEGPEDYIAKAIDLAANRDRLTCLKKALRTRLLHSPFCDAKRFTADMEQTYLRLWNERNSSESNAARLTQETTAEKIDPLMTLFAQGRYTEGEALARLQTQRLPQYGFGWKALGVMCLSQGHTVESLEPMQKAAILLPMDAEAHFNLGNALKALGRQEEAEASYHRALEIKPDYAEAHSNLGATLNNLGRQEEAVASFRQALEIKPHLAEAHNNLGNALNDLGRLEEAEASFRRALEIKQDYADAHNNLGNIFKDLGRLEEAEACYRRVLEINPDDAEAHSNLLFTLNYSSHHLSYTLKEAHRFGQMVSRKAGSPFSSWQCVPRPERLRVGLVSGDLRNHPVSYFLENVLAQINPSRLELIAYATDYKIDELTVRIKPYFSVWESLVGLSDEAAARLIHTDGIHLLLDLSGHTAKNRLPIFAWKPAPVQASWLGYSGTTGVPQIDYILGDPYVTPHEEEGHFTEKIWQIPESYLCLTPPDMPVKIGPLPALTTGRITFGCFNNLTKMGDDAVALWSRVLHAIPGSMLFLRTRQLHNSRALENTKQRFAAHGIACNRLILDGTFSGRTELFEAYNCVDIALDPFPYNGTTTSVEGLWMGIPVLTRRGNRFHSHVGESIAHNAGLIDWIADNDDDYVAKAVMHTTDLERLATLRSKLRRQVLTSPLFDAPRFAQHFETALWGMWEQWQSQLPPAIQICR